MKKWKNIFDIYDKLVYSNQIGAFMYKYHIKNVELNSNSFEKNKKRIYKLETYGNDVDELLNNSTVRVFDENGEEIWADDVMTLNEKEVSYVKNFIKKTITKKLA